MRRRVGRSLYIIVGEGLDGWLLINNSSWGDILRMIQKKKKKPPLRKNDLNDKHNAGRLFHICARRQWGHFLTFGYNGLGLDTSTARN